MIGSVNKPRREYVPPPKSYFIPTATFEWAPPNGAPTVYVAGQAYQAPTLELRGMAEQWFRSGKARGWFEKGDLGKELRRA